MADVDPRDDPAAVVAANRVMLELWTILAGFAEAMTIVGGSAPPLLVGERPEDPYAGTLDVNVVIDPAAVPSEVYRTIAETLRGRGYAQMDQPFRWLRSVSVEARPIDVEVDLLAPMTPRAGTRHRHERIGGEPLARRTEGAEILRAGYTEREVTDLLPDGRRNRLTIRVATPAALIVLKALAMGGRDKPKDAYDIDYILRHVGNDAVAGGIEALGDVPPVVKALGILDDKFGAIDAIGPTSVALYRRVPLGTAEADQLQALAYARVRDLLRRLGRTG